MLRPSDAALLRRSQVVFDEHNRFCEICLLGFKTDGQALGETVRIPAASVPKLCPHTTTDSKVCDNHVMSAFVVSGPT